MSAGDTLYGNRVNLFGRRAFTGPLLGPAALCSRRSFTDGDPPGVSSGYAYRSSATMRGMPGEVAVRPPDGIDCCATGRPSDPSDVCR